MRPGRKMNGSKLDTENCEIHVNNTFVAKLKNSPQKMYKAKRSPVRGGHAVEAAEAGWAWLKGAPGRDSFATEGAARRLSCLSPRSPGQEGTGGNSEAFAAEVAELRFCANALCHHQLETPLSARGPVCLTWPWAPLPQGSSGSPASSSWTPLESMSLVVGAPLSLNPNAKVSAGRGVRRASENQTPATLGAARG